MSSRALVLAAFTLTVSAQESAPSLTAAEKEFQDTLSGSVLVGSFSREGRQGLTEDRYVIESATKIKENLWRIVARIQYSGKDLKVPLMIPVLWAGDTPMMSLTDFMVPGFGTFSARILFYKGGYAGTWSPAKGNGGLMFGRVVKEKPAQ